MNPTGFGAFLVAAPVGLLSLIAVATAIIPHRREITARALLALFGFSLWLLGTNLLELVSPPGAQTLFFAKLEYFGYFGIGLSWLSFCLRFTGWVTMGNWRLIAMVSLVPAGLMAIVLTNDQHHLFWTNIEYLVDGNLSVLRAGRGPAFWLGAAFVWGCVSFGTFLVLRSYFSGERTYYRQSLWVVAGALLPAVTNVVYLLQVIPGLRKDFTPVAFALSGAMFALGIYLHQLLWVMPTARGVVLQDLPLAIVVLDNDGRIIDHNRRADEFFGLDGIACVGRDVGRYPALLRALAAAGVDPRHPAGPAPGKLQGTTELGGRSLSWTLQPGIAPRRQLIFMTEDTTERVGLAAELDRLKNELVRQEKMATVGLLVAGVAHEINNPLGYIQSNLRSLSSLLAKDLPADAPRRDDIADLIMTISAGLESIGTTVGGLLEFSSHGRTDTPRKPFDLRWAVETTLGLCRSELRGVAEVHCDWGPSVRLATRRNEIEQVILNLLTNAIYALRHRPAGGAPGLIEIRTGLENGRAFCEIGNNGPPLAEADRERIFTPFHTTKPEDHGTGLGLSVSRDIVEKRHDGSLGLVSLDPVRFRLELPIPPGSGAE